MQTLSDVLVVGGNGFIGSHLVKFLGCDSVDLHDGFDVRDELQVKETVAKYRCVINLAAVSDVDACNKDKKLAYDVNVKGALNVFKYSSSCILFSSAAVYGNLSRKALESDTLLPISYYGYTKALMELSAIVYAGLQKKNFVILRPFNIVGEGSKGVIEKFRNNDVLHVYGNTYRDFIDVSALCKYVRFFSDNIALFHGDVFNIGSGHATSIIDIAKKSGKTIVHHDQKQDDIVFSCADIRKLSACTDMFLSNKL
jgi:nucleoside-diphosphate-sugar epimerase